MIVINDSPLKLSDMFRSENLLKSITPYYVSTILMLTMKPHDVPFKQNFTYCWIKFEIESLDNSILKVQDLQVLFHFDHLRTNTCTTRHKPEVYFFSSS